MVYHNVYEFEDRREPYILHSNLEDNRRVLTVRTMQIFRNQTEITYHVKIFYLDKLNDKVVIIADKVLEPGQSMPLPDHADPEIKKIVKIAIRPSKVNCKKWS